MLFSDTYQEPEGAAEATLRERGSRFLAYAFSVKTEDDVRLQLQRLRTQYPDATHHCYAFVLHPDQSARRAADDGEPANSAGKPIFRAIQSCGLTNVLVVVVRYFGGTQLGIPGLIQAYGDAAMLALKQLKVHERWVELNYTLETDFAHEQDIHRIMSMFQTRVLGCTYGEGVSYRLAVRSSQANAFEQKVKQHYQISIRPE